MGDIDIEGTGKMKVTRYGERVMSKSANPSTRGYRRNERTYKEETHGRSLTVAGTSSGRPSTPRVTEEHVFEHVPGSAFTAAGACPVGGACTVGGACPLGGA